MPGGDPVHGIGVIGDVGSPTCQLLAKSYRARSRRQRRLGQSCDSIGELGRRSDEWLPEPLSGLGVESGERFTPASVEHSEQATLGTRRLAHSPAKRIEGANPGHRQAGAGGKAARRGESDAYTDEGPRAEPDRDPPNGIPAAGRRHRPLDLSQ